MESCGAVTNLDEKSSIKVTDFCYQRVVRSFSNKKCMFLCGKISSRAELAAGFFERTPFDLQIIKNLCTVNSSLEKKCVNGSCTNYRCFPAEISNEFKISLIYPASEKHIEKYENHPVHIIQETPEIYANVVLPYIKRKSFSIQWVYNILDYVTEKEEIIYEDIDLKKGFIILPDFKWNKKSVENLHVLAICRARNIKSLRDLRAEHIPMLKNIQEKGTEAIEKLYGLGKNQLRIFFHYQPSYYHLHVHFTNINYKAPGIHTAKAHFLESVIQNITFVPNYYQNITLSFLVKESDELYTAIKEYEYSKKSSN